MTNSLSQSDEVAKFLTIKKHHPHAHERIVILVGQSQRYTQRTSKHISNQPSWWFQPLWKILVKMGIFPNRPWTQKIFETTT